MLIKDILIITLSLLSSSYCFSSKTGLRKLLSWILKSTLRKTKRAKTQGFFSQNNSLCFCTRILTFVWNQIILSTNFILKKYIEFLYTLSIELLWSNTLLIDDQEDLRELWISFSQPHLTCISRHLLSSKKRLSKN